MSVRGLAITASLCVATLSACWTGHSSAPVTPHAKPQPVTAATYPQSATVHLTPDVVLATIRDRYLNGVERCYTRHAKALGTASGRVTVSFTVDEQGKTLDGDAHGITKMVDGCIRAQVARWTFPAPKKQSAFSLGLQLSTD